MSDQSELLRQAIARGVSRDYVASRGEYLNGLIMAAFLNAEFVDPQECILLTANGGVHPDTYAMLGQRLADGNRRFVVPGFYGRDAKGEVKTFSRGGSDITGAIVARAAKASLYENWTDVLSFLWQTRES